VHTDAYRTLQHRLDLAEQQYPRVFSGGRPEEEAYILQTIVPALTNYRDDIWQNPLRPDLNLSELRRVVLRVSRIYKRLERDSGRTQFTSSFEPSVFNTRLWDIFDRIDEQLQFFVSRIIDDKEQQQDIPVGSRGQLWRQLSASDKRQVIGQLARLRMLVADDQPLWDKLVGQLSSRI
jgi:hypothetical protein